jgi:DNA-binding GntR family transcriptional regulator
MPAQREQIAATLRDRIASGEYQERQKLPSYRALVAEFGGSRETAAAAVRLLASEGLVELRDKSSAVVRPRDRVALSPEARIADARAEVLALRDDVADLQRSVDEVNRRVADVLSRLGR